MSPSRINYVRRSVRWLLPAALLALTPKCLLCLLAYAGIGAALGLSGPEICGATSSSPMSLWMVALALIVLPLSVLGLIGFYARHRNRRPNNPTSATPGQ
jgi:hypothetical protein